MIVDREGSRQVHRRICLELRASIGNRWHPGRCVDEAAVDSDSHGGVFGNIDTSGTETAKGAVRRSRFTVEPGPASDAITFVCRKLLRCCDRNASRYAVSSPRAA
jgi:hypothetical protein